MGDGGHGNVEDVDVLLADQVEQQVERALEGFEEDLQRIRRDIEILRQLGHRLAVDQGERQLLLGARLGIRRLGWRCFVHRGLSIRPAGKDRPAGKRAN
ncbi:hypothetical protein D9M72_529100 [compost metagenome]